MRRSARRLPGRTRRARAARVRARRRRRCGLRTGRAVARRTRTASPTSTGSSSSSRRSSSSWSRVPLIYFVVRFRSRGRPRTVDGPQIHGSTRLELAWTVAPVLILVAIGGFIFYKLKGIDDPAGAAAEPAGSVLVEGRQFYWQFVYPNGVIAVERLRVPVDRVDEPAGHRSARRRDPQLLGARARRQAGRDPGEPERDEASARPRRALYPVRCAELCGIQHGAMNGSRRGAARGRVRAWLSERGRRAGGGLDRRSARRPIAVRARRATASAATGFIGPPLAGNPIVAQPDAVETSCGTAAARCRPSGRAGARPSCEALTRLPRRQVATAEGADGSQG